MKKEEFVDIRGMFCWMREQWKKILALWVVGAVALTILMFSTEKISYRQYESTLYTKDFVLARMSDADRQNVLATIDIDELIADKNARIEEIDVLDTSEESLYEKEALIQRVFWLGQLRLMYIAEFNDYQNRYYFLMSGGVDEQRTVPHITATLLFGAVVLSLIAVIVILAVLYILNGYLHSKDELKVRYPWKIYEIDAKQGKIEEYVRMALESQGIIRRSGLALVDVMNIKGAHKEEAGILQKIFGAEYLDDVLDNLDEQKLMMNAEGVILVAGVNQTRLKKLDELEKMCQQLGTNVEGIIIYIK